MALRGRRKTSMALRGEEEGQYGFERGDTDRDLGRRLRLQ